MDTSFPIRLAAPEGTSKEIVLLNKALWGVVHIGGRDPLLTSFGAQGCMDESANGDCQHQTAPTGAAVLLPPLLLHTFTIYSLLPTTTTTTTNTIATAAAIVTAVF